MGERERLAGVGKGEVGGLIGAGGSDDRGWVVTVVVRRARGRVVMICDRDCDDIVKTYFYVT